MTRRTDSCSERGALLLEFAIVVPVFLTMVMGIINLGIGFSRQHSLDEGVRQAARAAVVDDVGMDESCTIHGTPTTADTKRLICLVKDRVELGDEVRVAVVLSPAGPIKGEPILVCAQYDGGPLLVVADLPGLGKQSARSVMRLEADLAVAEFAEDNPSGSWSACTL